MVTQRGGCREGTSLALRHSSRALPRRAPELAELATTPSRAMSMNLHRVRFTPLVMSLTGTAILYLTLFERVCDAISRG